ncbi:zinc finger CCCH domain-containing protein 44 [Striga asiatica]|uniref:Zinc finger CCCH domain-containing protein 44 n=1 Tax=Striga asiatica TaxID=4170 RepID=A0A5A7QX83_STRAF|nr:zinc finger CCCH domain-containing protein 44 [Striga asiatica]
MVNIDTLLAVVAQTQGFEDEAVIPEDAPLREAVVAPAPGTEICAVGKRKRGRPPKGQQRVKPPPPQPKRSKMAEDEEEEDVCFICFDGGSLVLCDRKGCPKAYHPACIKRDEAFFRSKAKWNCGWHICSVCRKASYSMCYTCTYSLCKGCTEYTDYVRIRGNKGFCSTCMKTIMLIENKDQPNNEIKIDFDDQTSWEYLFKVYWVILKEKLSLTLNELTLVKKPQKDVTAVGYIPSRSILIPTAVSVEIPVTCSSTDALDSKKSDVENDLPPPTDPNNAETLNDGFGIVELTKQSMDKAMQETGIEEATDEPGIERDQDNLNTTKDTNKPCICKNTNEGSGKSGVAHCTEWATKNLLEFVARMKDGDVSAMSIFGVQTLLIEYINRNNLWDRRRKSQIKCDPGLKSIFGKARVGHIEMLKLLESHILVKEDCQNDSSIPAGFVSSVRSDGEVDELEEDVKSGDSSKKGKEESSVQAQDSTNDNADAGESNSPDNYTNQENTNNLTTNGTNDQDMQRSDLDTSTATASVENSPSPNITEIEKLWHYRDPDGKIRGPFSMLQLRECSTTGLYAPDMRIWTYDEQYDSVFLTDALSGRFNGASDSSNSVSQWEERGSGEIKVIIEGANVSGEESEKVDTPSNDASVSSKNDAGALEVDNFSSSPRCWDFLTDNSNHTDNSDVNSDVQTHRLLPPPRLEEKHELLMTCGQECENFPHAEPEHGEIEKSSTGLLQNPIASGREVQNVDNNLKSLNIDLSSNYTGLAKLPVSDKQVQTVGFLELLSSAPRPDHLTDTKNPDFANFPVQISEMVNELCKFPFAFSLKPPETTCQEHAVATSAAPSNPPPPNMASWLASANEPIEFDALGEESVSDLLAEVDAMESRGDPHSPSAASKFAREFLEDCKDECFGSIEELGVKNDALMRQERETNAPGGVGSGPPDICVGPGLGLGWDGPRKYGLRAQWGRSMAKGQRVCKFYESGHCRKGAFCDYLHPAHVETLQMLKSPEERSRRISETPELHFDPKMNPNYESDKEDTKSADVSKADKEERTVCTRNRARKKIKSLQSSVLETSPTHPSVENSQPKSIIETENLWHHRDPNSKIQGPFSMIQLRKWSMTGLFPADMRIWTNHEQYNSLLLTDYLAGKFHLASDTSNSSGIQNEEEEVPTDEIRVLSEITSVNNGHSNRASESENGKKSETGPIMDVLSPNLPKPAEIEPALPVEIQIPIHSLEILELLGRTPRPNNENHEFMNFPGPNPAQTWSSGPSKMSETIEFDSLGEEYVSDLLAEVDAMESKQQQQCGTRLSSPTSAIKFARELMEYCRDEDDCFSSTGGEQLSARSIS